MGNGVVDMFWQTLRPIRKVGKLRGVVEVPTFSVPTGPDNTCFKMEDGYWDEGGTISVDLFDAAGATMEGWVKIPPGLIATTLQIVDGIHGLYVNPDMTITARFRNTVPTIFNATSTIAINRNEWNHVAATCDGTTIYIYVNFVLAGSLAFTGSLKTNNGSVFRIMDTFNNTCGMLCNEIRTWSVARTLTQIQQAAYSPRNVDGTIDVGLTSYWPLDEGTGTTISNQVPATTFDLTYTSYSALSAQWVLDDSYPYKLGASYIAGWFLLDTSGRSFSFKFPATKPTADVNFVLCVSWVDADTGDVMRYRMWTQESVGDFLFDPFTTIALYNGELIPDGAKLEVWNLDGDRSVDLTTTIDIDTSILNVVTDPNTTTQTATATLASPIVTNIAEAFPLTPFHLTFEDPQTY